MRIIVFGILVLMSISLLGQDSYKQYDKFWIEFKDKDNSPYSIFKPLEYLSPRAIERRKKQGIRIQENDLPVNPIYLLQLRDLGAQVNYTSKWLNAASVTADSATYARILKLPFVKFGEAVGVSKPNKPPRPKKPIPATPYEKAADKYGAASLQIKQINGHHLHNLGYDGSGMLVAVLDGGFNNVDIMPFFDSLRATGRLLQGRDFVMNDTYPYESSSHGSQVLSTMGANLPGLMIGTAPGASYVCVKTEETSSELRIEEDNWVVGAEFADSLGADVINSSLGYTTFDDKRMNYTYEDMDGNTARVTRGADIAASKGILVVNSAGNSGVGEWKFIGAPADSDSVLAVGSVDAIGRKSYFSSFGPSSDGQVKPNVSAKGSSTAVASLYGYNTDRADGTSFASPVTAGMVASLWQAFPDKSNMEIIDAIQANSHLNAAPTDGLGYGVPDFFAAYLELSDNGTHLGGGRTTYSNSRNTKRVKDRYRFSVWNELGGTNRVEVQNLLGQVVYSNLYQLEGKTNSLLSIDNIGDWKPGVYYISVYQFGKIFHDKFIKE